MRKVQVVLQDDIDGGEPAETIHFALDGTEYEIDLTDDHVAALRESLEPWIAAARPTPASGIPGPTSQRDMGAVEIRTWARQNNIPVSHRGRISIDLRSRYEAAHQDQREER